MSIWQIIFDCHGKFMSNIRTSMSLSYDRLSCHTLLYIANTHIYSSRIFTNNAMTILSSTKHTFLCQYHMRVYSSHTFFSHSLTHLFTHGTFTYMAWHGKSHVTIMANLCQIYSFMFWGQIKLGNRMYWNPMTNLCDFAWQLPLNMHKFIHSSWKIPMANHYKKLP